MCIKVQLSLEKPSRENSSFFFKKGGGTISGFFFKGKSRKGNPPPWLPLVEH